ncbi:ATP-dependent nuclease [Phocoenobacter skyensis]|uniref:ATP-dependent endonuclease n=1 Tax=Phocoenobacter skyensis TaxID=97481 RepID=A0ABT9JJU2_9PAST|nr:ATP-dependent endonuclease [Pasteurella skyensis]MDP8079116.1 ATP-dependent endonuclease [Pasteurella skyensis]MDP8085066.1 ATP-dependent endonuclease [Pasteurella skyensis]
MKIEKIHIKNFRKLKNCPIYLTEKETIFVGANNSGKTSAMYALKSFLSDNRPIEITDFSLGEWEKINEIAQSWIDENTLESDGWKKYCPNIEVWLTGFSEIDLPKIKHILPSLNWKKSSIGVRLAFIPSDIDKLKEDFISHMKLLTEKDKSSDSPIANDMYGFLSEQKLAKYFSVQASLIGTSEEEKLLEGNPLKGIFKVSIISAQRGFDDTDDKKTSASKLSEYLGKYYEQHLNPSTEPTEKDKKLLNQLQEIEKTVSSELNKRFASPLGELTKLGYPGTHGNPQMSLSSVIDSSQIIKTQTAVHFNLQNGGTDEKFNLPERFNGLGYRNLIFIFFQLLAFRDGWQQVGKKKDNTENPIEPIHIVLIEEPEAHLHAQVQQVFIKNAYEFLIKEIAEDFTTQLIISTHSSYIVHEAGFDSLCYFKRQNPSNISVVPYSETVGLSTVFSEESENIEKTKKFVSRYLRVMHCDLLFADAVIMVEGAAERMLIPHFIRNKFERLNSKYLSILEVGGAHAHRFKPLIEKLGIPVLIIADLDSKEKVGKDKYKKIRPERIKGQISGCHALKEWFNFTDEKMSLDAVLDLESEKKEQNDVRITYQTGIDINFNGKPKEAIPYTFEDAVALSNIELINEHSELTGMLKKMQDAIRKDTIEECCKAMFKALEGDKAQMALDIMYELEIENLTVPKYISEGLAWLENKLCHQSNQVGDEIK